jgi:CelD/BcsL family acetyltransferase involved in cellulose biosynthesis
MRFVLSRRLADLPIGRTQWNALVDDTAGATVFQTYEWFECWWKAFGTRHSLFLITLWDDDALVGIAPLMLVRRAGLRQLEFAGSPNSDYQDFILGGRSADLLPQLVRYLHRQRNAWDVIVLRNVPTESMTFGLVPSLARSQGLDVIDDERIACPTFEIASRPAEIRSWLDRYSLRRRMNMLRRRGDLTFTRCSNTREIEHYMPLFFEQYVERRRGTVAADVFARPEVREFFTSLTKSMLPCGWLHFSVLECGGQPIAFHLGFEFRGRLYWYKPSFSPRFARESPGKVLLSFLIRDSLDRGLQELDFTIGAEPFKARYTSAIRTNANVRLFRWRILYFAAAGLIMAWRTLNRWRHRDVPQTLKR